MKLYHGGVIAVESPRIISGEQERDFGFAFYTTALVKLLPMLLQESCGKRMRSNGCVSRKSTIR